MRLQRFFSGRVAVATGDTRAVQPQAVSEAGGANYLGNQHSQVVNSTKNSRLSLDIRLDFFFLFFFSFCDALGLFSHGSPVAAYYYNHLAEYVQNPRGCAQLHRRQLGRAPENTTS